MSDDAPAPTDGVMLSPFQLLIDPETSAFKQDLQSADARRALHEFHTSATASIRQLRQAKSVSSAYILCQGSCFLYAFLQHHNLLRSAWIGSPCTLQDSAVHSFIDFKGGKPYNVRFHPRSLVSTSVYSMHIAVPRR